MPPLPSQLLPQLSVMILAGGRSSRMGQDKAFIPVQGIPLLQRTCEVARQCATQVLIVISQPETYRAIAPSDCQFVVESRPPADAVTPGPLVAFAQALPQVQTPWVLLLACDLPNLDAEILSRWAQQLETTAPAIAILPHTTRGWEPLCGFYHQQCQSSLQEFVQAGGRSFQIWLRQIPVQKIGFSPDPSVAQREHDLLFNCNTPDDLGRVQRDTVEW